jgi:lipid A disaccharide synthetase
MDIINAVAANLNDIRGAGKTEFALFGLSSIGDSYSRLAKGINLILDAGADGVAAACPSAALSVSGTIATELALMKIPTAIFYKVGALNAFILRAMIKIRTKYVSLPNILLDEEFQPEFLQENARAGAIASRVAGFLDGNPSAAAESFARVRRLLGPPDASRRVASSIIKDILGAYPAGRSDR